MKDRLKLILRYYNIRLGCINIFMSIKCHNIIMITFSINCVQSYCNSVEFMFKKIKTQTVEKPQISLAPKLHYDFTFVSSCFQEKRSRTVCRMARGTNTRRPEDNGPITPVAWTLTTSRCVHTQTYFMYLHVR